MKLAGITKIRDEQEIIQDTLDHFSLFCDAIYVYDDCSGDDTVKICEEHKNVRRVVRGRHWDLNRLRAEYQTRQLILEEAKKDSPEWFLYFDADERIEYSFNGYKHYDGIVMRLFDFYITTEDIDKPYYERRWLGPEYRDILMMFKNTPEVRYCVPDQREAILGFGARCYYGGYVKHYGKAISVEQWEKTCNYYATWFPEPFRSKWKGRKGKAVHTLSDFGRPLIQWHEKDEKGVVL